MHSHRGQSSWWTDSELYLFHVQRTDGSDVTDARFADHCLGKLNLCCDVGHLYWVVVVVCDVEGVLKGKKRWENPISVHCHHELIKDLFISLENSKTLPSWITLWLHLYSSPPFSHHCNSLFWSKKMLLLTFCFYLWVNCRPQGESWDSGTVENTFTNIWTHTYIRILISKY